MQYAPEEGQETKVRKWDQNHKGENNSQINENNTQNFNHLLDSISSL